MSNKLTVNESPNKILVNVNEDGEVFVEVLQGNLTVNGSMGAGDVVGPVLSTDNAIVRFNGTDGKLIQNSGITIADGATGTLSGTNSGDVTVTDTDTIDLTIAGQALSGAVRTQQSITSDASGIKLSGDSTSPGSSRYYGTDGGGSKGFHALPAATPGGVDTQVQFNDGGSFGGDAGLTYNKTTDTLSAANLSGVNIIQLDTTPSSAVSVQGQLGWNADEETVDIQLNSFTLHVGEHTVYHVKNDTGSTIAKGVPVMFAGTVGSSGKLNIAPWNGTGPSIYFMGLTAEELSNGEEGFVIAFGKIRGIQTNGANYGGQTWTNGEIIYLGTTTGSLTDTQPAAPNPHVIVAAVVSAHATNGTLFIRPSLGSNIKDDEGVTITSLTSGQLLVANSAGTVFENKSVSGDATLANTGALTIASGAVSYAKIQDVSAASRLLGRGSAGGAGDVEELSIGSGLSLSGTTLSATVVDTGITQLTGDVTAGPGNGSQASTIANNAVTYAKIQDVSAASRLLGRGSASGAGDVQELSLGTNLSMSGTTLNATGGGGIGGSTGAADNAILRADGTGGSTLQASLVEIADSGMVSSPTGFEVVPADSTAWRSQLVGNRLELYRDDGLGVTSNVFLVGTELSATGTLALTNPDATGTREILLDGVAEFTQLADTPASYTGQAGKVVAVKGTEDGLEFIAAGGGSIGGTVGTVDNAIPRANGTGGSTLQGSDVSITDAGEVKFADGVDGGAGQSLGGLIAGNGGASSTTNAGGGGGYVYMLGGAADSTGTGGDAGSLFMLGGDASSGNGASAGNINTSASFGLSGGNITTAGGGGSINTTGSGSIQLGAAGTRTTILGAAASDWNLTLPTGPGNLGEVLTTNGSGTTSWVIPAEATAALGLKTATTTVSVSAATAPTSGQVLTATSGTAATWQTLGGGGIGGSDTQVQFNDGGVFGGDAGLTYNKTTNTLTAGVFSGSGASLTTLNASNLSSGTVASARLPNPTTGAIGGVMRNTGSVGQFVSGIAVNGELQYGSPAGGLANITETLNTGSPNITVNAEQLAVTGGTTNVNLVLTPRGTGGFMLGAPPDGTATGGNIIGTRAVDLQLAHGAAARVASGTESFAAGSNNTASGSNSTAIGNFVTASGTYAVCLGYNSTATNNASFSAGSTNTVSGQSAGAVGESITSSAYASFGSGYGPNARLAGIHAMSGYFGWGSGGSQAIRYLQSITTTNATPTEIFGSWNQGERYTIPSGNTHFVQIRITAASTTNTASYARQVCIRNTAGTTALVGSVQTIGTDQETDAAWDVTVEANDTNDALRILVTGAASTTIRWLALIDGVELKNP